MEKNAGSPPTRIETRWGTPPNSFGSRRSNVQRKKVALPRFPRVGLKSTSPPGAMTLGQDLACSPRLPRGAQATYFNRW
nr:hypothetical protein [Candidatus Njordarchaeum guaymaensis]